MSLLDQAIQSLYEDAEVRSDLNDDDADRLLHWGSEQIRRIAETQPQVSQSVAKFVRDLLRQINRFAGRIQHVDDPSTQTNVREIVNAGQALGWTLAPADVLSVLDYYHPDARSVLEGVLRVVENAPFIPPVFAQAETEEEALVERAEQDFSGLVGFFGLPPSDPAPVVDASAQTESAPASAPTDENPVIEDSNKKSQGFSTKTTTDEDTSPEAHAETSEPLPTKAVQDFSNLTDFFAPATPEASAASAEPEIEETPPVKPAQDFSSLRDFFTTETTDAQPSITPEVEEKPSDPPSYEDENQTQPRDVSTPDEPTSSTKQGFDFRSTPQQLDDDAVGEKSASEPVVDETETQDETPSSKTRVNFDLFDLDDEIFDPFDDGPDAPHKKE